MLSASNSLLVKPWQGLRRVLARRWPAACPAIPARRNREGTTAAPALPDREFLYFLAAWSRFCTATGHTGPDTGPNIRPDQPGGDAPGDSLRQLALACVDALEPLDAAPCPVLRQRLALWQAGPEAPGMTTGADRPGPLLPDAPQSLAKSCASPQDVAAFCHARAVGRLLALAAADSGRRVHQLRDGVPKQFWALELGRDCGGEEPCMEDAQGSRKHQCIEVGSIASPPMQALWYGMNALPWQGPPAMNGRGFLSVLFEATANPQLDPAAEKALFYQKNHFLLTPDYCHLHSRFGFHVVAAEARLTDRPQANHLLFQLQGGAANLERRHLRALLVAELLAPFGFRAEVRQDAVAAWRSNLDREEGWALAAVMGYIAIHTRQLDMIMQDGPAVAARRSVMLAHCRALQQGQSLS